MNNAKLQFDAGNLGEAIESALTLVKQNPTNAAARTFLFELCLFSGEWDRAAKQLDVIGHQDVGAAIGSKIFQQNIKAEQDRINVFTSKSAPGTAMAMPKYIDDLLLANHQVQDGNTAEARQTLDRVDEERPAFSVKINGEAFSDLRDYNDLTNCIFEVIIKDTYAWLPFEQASRIEFIERKSLRDVYWLQAKVDWINGTSGEVFIPALYVNSWKNGSDAVRLGRTVEWRDLGDDVYTGEGVRVFAVNGRDIPILDIQTIEFDHEAGDE